MENDPKTSIKELEVQKSKFWCSALTKQYDTDLFLYCTSHWDEKMDFR